MAFLPVPNGRLLTDFKGSAFISWGDGANLAGANVACQSGPEGSQKGLDFNLGTLRLELDAAVGLVPNPARQVERVGDGAGRGSEAHTLDPSNEVGADSVHRDL